MTGGRPTPTPAGPGQESVWDYPRPPRVASTTEEVVVSFNDVQIARTRGAWRVLETSHAPTYYIPRADVHWQYLFAIPQRTWCEFKGAASYADVVVGDRTAPAACWWYASPTPRFAAIAGAVCFYPERVSAWVDGEPVRGVGGGFYGDWVTSRVVGPFKGPAGTEGW